MMLNFFSLGLQIITSTNDSIEKKIMIGLDLCGLRLGPPLGLRRGLERRHREEDGHWHKEGEPT